MEPYNLAETSCFISILLCGLCLAVPLFTGLGDEGCIRGAPRDDPKCQAYLGKASLMATLFQGANLACIVALIMYAYHIYSSRR